jgi:acetoin utilization deacetylase AcuC-like enzyme
MKMTMDTLIVYAPAMGHTLRNHPESHERMVGLMPLLERHGVLSEMKAISPVLASTEQLRRVHSPGLIEHIQAVCLNGGGLLDQGDTYTTAYSYELARIAAGSCCSAVDEIMTGQARNGIALVRPPGHHAERDRVSGFCLFNNVAAAARQAQAVHGVKRVLILDFDVHHGNGTQDIFYDDDTVLFVSMHLYAPFFYPGIGSIRETGIARGQGFTLNVPLPPYVGDQGYCRILNELVLPKATEFDPELILISAGFDAHWRDPLAAAGLSLTGYAQLVRTLIQMAENLCDGRILFVLEGGYQMEALTYGILNTVFALIGRDQVLDNLGSMPQLEYDVTDLLYQLQRRHLPK